MTKTPALGDLIRESRLALGYSLGQLATKVGDTAAAVRTWERGEAVPDEESRTALESVLDIDPGRLESLLSAETAETEDAEDAATASDADEGLDEEEPEPGADAAAVAGGLAAVAGAAEPDGSVAESDVGEVSGAPDEDESPGDPGDHEASDGEAAALVAESEEADSDAAEPEGSETELPIVPLVTEGVPLGDEEAPSADNIGVADDTDDTLEGVAAVTPFEVDPELIDEPTEAVVVPVVAAATGVATQTRSVVTVSEPKERRSRNPLRAFFDPEKRWLYWLRALLTIVVAVVLVYVLVWAAGELFDALGQVLDSIEPTEVDDGSIDALGRFRTRI